MYYIRNKKSGKFLEADTTDNNIYARYYTGSNAQKWTVYDNGDGTWRLYAPIDQNSKYLTVAGASSANDTYVHVYPINLQSSTAKKAESLKIAPNDDFTYKILTAASDFKSAIDIRGGSGENNIIAVQNSYTEADSQKWYFEEVTNTACTQIESGGIYQFRAYHSGKYIDADSHETYLVQNNQDYGDGQKFRVTRYNNTEYFTISPLSDQDKLVKMSDGVTGYGFHYTTLGDNTVTDAALFKFVYNSEFGGFQIISKLDNTQAFDVAYYRVTEGTEIILSGKANDVNRFFTAEPLGEALNSSASYQNNGNYLHTLTDNRGNTTTYTYDSTRDLQTGVTDAKSNTVSYTYNQQTDRLMSVSAGSKQVQYSYNGDGTLSDITSPSSTLYHFTYTNFLQPYQTYVGSRKLVENTYEPRSGLLTNSTYSNGNTVGYSYDTLDRVSEKLYNGNVRFKYRYNKLGQLYRLQNLINGVTTCYGYDLSGRISDITTTNGSSIFLEYDNFNRIKQQKYGFSNISVKAEYIYGDIASNQKAGLIYGVKQNDSLGISYSYDKLLRLNTRTLNTASPFVTEHGYMAGSAANTTTTLLSSLKNGNDTLNYTYDELGNITAISKNGVPYESYTYDASSQLTTVTRGNDIYEYTYDNGGNILSVKKNGEVVKSYGYTDSEWKDLLTSYNGQSLTYDQIGNPITYRNEMHFTWANGRQLSEITKNESRYIYEYDDSGLRSKKTVNGTVTDYYWLNGMLLGQKTGDEHIAFLYDENGSAYGMLVKNGSGTESYYYYVFNAQGDVTGILDQNGTQVVSYDYDVWGSILSITDTSNANIGSINPLRYRGYYYDNETGFYYVSSRYYDPEIGRWINADSLLSQGSVLGNNMFAYCLNNPVNMADTTGQLPFFLVTAAIGAVVGAVVGGVVAAKNGGNVWAGIGIGAAVGGLAGAGLGAAAGVMLAGSATASTAAVASGAGMLATAVSTGGAGAGLALVADNISRAVNNVGTVLYSGGDQARQAATTFANNTGGTTIDPTVIGQVADAATKVPGADFTTVWSQASAAFCNQASGVVNAFVSNSAYRGVDSIFWSVEMPTLLNNPRVTEIIIHIFE